ncbi:MAG: 30S ribosomal protein S3 [Nanoarchaeota archaeon]|nr:30S ribosomal protein S3 [Nanoarchaeota archaeon]
MTQEKKFVSEAIRRAEVENFLSKEFARAGYSHTEIQRTPLAMRITVYAHKPGLIIGRGGKNVDRMTEVLKKKFSFENPQLDIQEVGNPNIDAHVIANQISDGIQRGLNYKRVANMTIQKVMNSGALGIAIRISGKVGGAMARTEKFLEGYLKFSGDTAETLVDKAYSRAQVKLGTIGIQVRILTQLPPDRIISKRVLAGDIYGDNKEKAN